MDIWNNKLYTFIRCNRAVETLLLIFSHIIKGEKMIEKNLKKSPTTVNDPSTSTAGTERNFWSENNRLDNANLQTLVEMGFPRRVAIEAIMANGDDVNAATEWILQNNILLSVCFLFRFFLTHISTFQRLIWILFCTNNFILNQLQIVLDNSKC